MIYMYFLNELNAFKYYISNLHYISYFLFISICDIKEKNLNILETSSYLLLSGSIM